jgi:signal recognition particle GTPase
MFDKRITLVMGHYGSGKTTVAVNYAKALKKTKDKVSIYDLDIVNPYYRTVDAISILEESGVELVVSPFAETNVDIPAMNSKSYKMVDDKESFAVVDVGGDDRGALALGRFASKIKEENNYDCLLVVNKYRPETRDVEGVKAILKEIEIASRIAFTGIVNNSNLGKETTEKEIYEGYKFCLELSNELNLPIKFTAVERHLVEKIKDIKNILPVDCIKYGDWL